MQGSKLLLLLLLITLSTAQLRIYQVEKPGSGNGVVVTFKNFGSSPVDASGYYVGSDNQRIPIHSTENNSREVRGVGPVVPAGGTWTVDYSPWASQTPSSGKFSQSADVSLWQARSPDQTLLDFMQYCNMNQGTTCPDYGSYGRADLSGVWDRTTVSDRHVTYFGGFPTFRFLGGVNDRGRRFWTSDESATLSPTSQSTSGFTTRAPTTTTSGGVTTTRAPTTLRPTPAPPVMSDSVPCQVLEVDIFQLLLRLIQLKVKLGC
jgi:hypothetical protein